MTRAREFALRYLGGLFLGMLAGSAALAGTSEWAPREDRDGVTVSTRSVEGSGVEEFRASVVVRGAVDDVLAVVRDVERYSEWFGDCTSARRVSATSADDWVHYYVSGQPFPVSDRDAFVHMTVARNAATGGARVTVKGVPAAGPEVDGMVRVPVLEGHWEIEPAESGTTRAVYQLRAEPGGSVPDFVANLNVTSVPLATMKALRARVEAAAQSGAAPR